MIFTAISLLILFNGCFSPSVGCTVGDSPACLPLTSNSIQERHMRELISIEGTVWPCGFFPFCASLVNRTSDKVLMTKCGDFKRPTGFAEIQIINTVFRDINRDGTCGMFDADCWQSLTLYAIGEPNPMSAAALRLARIGEVVWGTSISTLMTYGWPMISINSEYIDKSSRSSTVSINSGSINDDTQGDETMQEESTSQASNCAYDCQNVGGILGNYETVWVPSVLSDETDVLFQWQFARPTDYTIYGDCPNNCTQTSYGRYCIEM